jgi:pimeloyl-ACP methyl ester carboxylesterase
MTSFPSATLRPPRTTVVETAPAPFTVEDRDRTRPFLLLHGGGGPATMSAFAALLAERGHCRVLLPTHPGFAGTPRPERLTSTRDLAAAYVALLDELDLSDVTLIGNSFGGWLAAEIALLGSPRVSGAVLVDAVGLQVDGHAITDVRGLTPPELRQLSFHDPSKAPQPPAGAGAGPGPDVRALLAYTGPTMSDPSLAKRLGELRLPVHVVWGESDGIVDVEYGRAFADAIAQSVFTVLPRTGHLPQVETPEELLGALGQ